MFRRFKAWLKGECFHEWKYGRENLKYVSLDGRYPTHILTWVRWCTKCKRKEYRSQLPKMSGYNSGTNEWREIKK